jgi:transposase-like protein
VVSDARESLKATVAKVLNACWQRCRVHFMRNALAMPASRRATPRSYTKQGETIGPPSRFSTGVSTRL